MTRSALPDRRVAVTVRVVWNDGGPDHHLTITFGFDGTANNPGHLKEAFVASFRAEGGIVALANDACILYSRCLQHGDGVQELANTMVENRKDGETTGAPASMMGAIARKAVEVQNDVNRRQRSND